MREIRGWVYDEVTMELKCAQEAGADGWDFIEDLLDEMVATVRLAVEDWVGLRIFAKDGILRSPAPLSTGRGRSSSSSGVSPHGH